MLIFKFTDFSRIQFFSNYQTKTWSVKKFWKFFTQSFFTPSKIIKEFHKKKIIISNFKINLIGGGKKRKKKNYTKPKKIKHVKKILKLRVLNYYSISEGKIKKLKKNSPHAPGCFMAEHHDRITCGKTGLTIARSV